MRFRRLFCGSGIMALAAFLTAGCVKAGTTSYSDSTEMHDQEVPESIYPGDTLAQCVGRTFLREYRTSTGGLESIEDTFIIAFEGQQPKDTCHIEREVTDLSVDGTTLMLAIGVDTVKYDFSQLPESINPVRDLLRGDYREHRVEHSFGLTDAGRKSKFRLSVWLPEKYPVWLNQFVASVLHYYMEEWINDRTVEGAYMEEYVRLKAHPRKYSGLDTSKSSMEETGWYFARMFEKLYHEKNDYEEMEHYDWGGPLFEFNVEVTPGWMSDDGKLSTYRFFLYNYGDGAHGMMYEFYLTFDTATGRILGRRDFFKDKDFEDTMLELGKEIGRRRFMDAYNGQTADIGVDDDVPFSGSPTYESFGGLLYPRPALLGDKVVFSYQPYDKGSFLEGVLHFALPYP